MHAVSRGKSSLAGVPESRALERKNWIVLASCWAHHGGDPQLGDRRIRESEEGKHGKSVLQYRIGGVAPVRWFFRVLCEAGTRMNRVVSTGNRRWQRWVQRGHDSKTFWCPCAPYLQRSSSHKSRKNHRSGSTPLAHTAEQ